MIDVLTNIHGREVGLAADGALVLNYDDGTQLVIGEKVAGAADPKTTRLTAQQVAAVGAAVSPGGLPLLIGASNQLGSSSSTSEVALFTLTIPAGTMGLDDALVIEPVYRFVGANGTRTLRIKAGATLGTANTIWSAAHAATVLSSQPYVRLRNRHSLTSQVASWASNTGSGSALGYGSSSTDLTLLAIDFSLDTKIYVTMQLANALDLAEQISCWVQVQTCVVA